MKVFYNSPEIEFVSIRLQDVLAVSKDEISATTGVEHPTDDWLEDDGL